MGRLNTGRRHLKLVFSRPSDKDRYRPCSKRVQQRLALYHGVRALYLEFSADAEETFSEAIKLLLVRNEYLNVAFFYIFFTIFVCPYWYFGACPPLAVSSKLDARSLLVVRSSRNTAPAEHEEVALSEPLLSPSWTSHHFSTSRPDLSTADYRTCNKILLVYLNRVCRLQFQMTERVAFAMDVQL
jgi:hypothetical protein